MLSRGRHGPRYSSTFRLARTSRASCYADLDPAALARQHGACARPANLLTRQIARLAELNDEALAIELAAHVRLGIKAVRAPLMVAGVKVDPTDIDVPHLVPATASDRGRLGPWLLSESSTTSVGAQGSPATVPRNARTPVFGCRLCVELLPTTEAAAWTHVLKQHRKVCEPADAAIWAALLGLAQGSHAPL